MIRVFEGIELGKWTKRKTFANRTPSSHFRRFNLSLMSCSPAELISVSIEQSKFQFNQLYLQTVEKGNHLPRDNKFLFEEKSNRFPKHSTFILFKSQIALEYFFQRFKVIRQCCHNF